ncbi:MAG: ribonuclease HII [Thermoplasmatales archaeon]|nr:ribonuclease HII [Thermoplasmatales archaeon]MCW6170260.1 ribonuclease HII [Thermoplasmatales archaeon]
MSSENISCGIDEAGRGPVIGPLVVTIVCGNNDVLAGLGVKDSKKLSPIARERLYTEIMAHAEIIKTEIITAAQLNLLMDTENLNYIEQLSYVSLARMSPDECTVYVDSFDVNPGRLGRLIESETGRKVVSAHKADEVYPVVSAASIISKVIRDREVKAIEERYGTMGSGYPSDPRTIKFIQESLKNGTDLSGIVRTKWKTYKTLVSRLMNSKLF